MVEKQENNELCKNCINSTCCVEKQSKNPINTPWSECALVIPIDSEICAFGDELCIKTKCTIENCVSCKKAESPCIGCDFRGSDGCKDCVELEDWEDTIINVFETTMTKYQRLERAQGNI